MPVATTAEAAVSSSAQPVIEVTDVVKTFNGRNVLDGVSLTVRRGETLVIMGASGCGKSTLLRCLIGAHKPDRGVVKLFGKDIWSVRARELDKLRKRFGILFQSGALFSSMSVGDNVALPLKEHTDLGADMIDLMVKVKLELVGLREAEERLPSEISGGMAKRAGLARAIALDPELLFYDEPTSGLDPIMTGIIDGLIVDLARTMNVTSVVVTHDLKSAFRVADRMVVLNNGRIVLQGMPHEIRASSDPFVKRFIHGPVESRTAVIPKSGSGFISNPTGATLVSSARNQAVGQARPVVPDKPAAAALAETAIEPGISERQVEQSALAKTRIEPAPGFDAETLVPRQPEILQPIETDSVGDAEKGESGNASADNAAKKIEDAVRTPDTRVKRPGSFPFLFKDRAKNQELEPAGSEPPVPVKPSSSLEAVPPNEAADELARDLAETNSEKTPDKTQIVEMETILVQHFEEGAKVPAATPAPADAQNTAGRKA